MTTAAVSSPAHSQVTAERLFCYRAPHTQIFLPSLLWCPLSFGVGNTAIHIGPSTPPSLILCALSRCVFLHSLQFAWSRKESHPPFSSASGFPHRKTCHKGLERKNEQVQPAGGSLRPCFQYRFLLLCLIWGEISNRSPSGHTSWVHSSVFILSPEHTIKFPKYPRSTEKLSDHCDVTSWLTSG